MTDHWIALFPLTELPADSSKGFDLEINDKKLELVLVHKEGKVVAYHNSCPHLGIRLEWQPDQFLDADGYFIQCSTHAALFTVHDGYCISGPCSGRSLKAVAVEIRDGVIGILAGG